ncbi:Imm64 family immunity protein [Halalkalibacter alkalisediminis]|uniref:Imm64 family immunity protein n=1 Tax=Halalkalibacter alkalisediminis TaxID=935616 RepID=A0ABV6NQ79_9BACI|nr:Imm64 family immunity protein [Halalkalibacter alkalisediminis]
MAAGGYINIAQVFNDNGNIQDKLEATLQYFVKQGSTILKVKYSKDADGENWAEREVTANQLEIDGPCYYLSIEISGEILGINIFFLTTIHEEGFFGFLINIEWEELFPENGKNDLQSTTNQLVKNTANLYKETGFAYSLIGHELEIEIHPDDISGESDSFPVVLIGAEEKLEILYGPFCIDGLTEQKAKREVVLI